MRTLIGRCLTALSAALLLVVVASCAPTLAPMGPRTAQPHLADGALRAGDGHVLPLRRWLPAGPPRAVILALHGFNDYSNAFDRPGSFWAAHGIATYAYDQRGFGRAEPRGRWSGADTMVADMVDAATAIAAAHPGVPLYLLGESMGGAVLLAGLTDRGLPAGVVGAILSAPAVWSRDTMPFYQRWALAIASRTLPWMELKAPKGLKIQASDNIEMLRALGRDPLVIKATRVDAMYGLTNLMDRAMQATSRFDVRSLILYGENEQVVPREPVDIALGRLPLGAADGPRVAVYPDGWHLLLRDLKAEIVWRDVLAWIDDPVAPLPSGADRSRRVLALTGQAAAGGATATARE